MAAALAGAAAYFVKTMGWFDVQLPNEMVTEAVTMEADTCRFRRLRFRTLSGFTYLPGKIGTTIPVNTP